MAKTINYFAYGEDRKIIKSGKIVIRDGMFTSEDDKAGYLMEMVCREVGEAVFDDHVYGVRFNEA